MMNFMLKERIEALVSVISIADSAPPLQSYQVFNHLSKQINEKVSELKKIEENDLKKLNKKIEQAGIDNLLF